LRHEYPISAVPHATPRYPLGPVALPGTYTVKLTAGGQTYTSPLTVKMDPRVKTPPAGLAQQSAAEKRLAGVMTGTTKLILEARAVQEQVDKLRHDATGLLGEHVAAFDKKLKAALGALQPLNMQASMLYGSLDSADAAPTAAQNAALAKLAVDLPKAIDVWTKLKAADLQALNRELKSANLPAIHPRADSAREDDSDDSDDVG
jgi:hypothetical protein